MHRTPGLDTLRAIAIAWVMLFHSYLVGGLGDGFSKLEGSGWMGVDLFFVLSGYLIGTQVLKSLKRTGTLDFAGFYRRRFVRILPAFFVVLALYAFWPAWRETPGMQPLWKFVTVGVAVVAGGLLLRTWLWSDLLGPARDTDIGSGLIYLRYLYYPTWSRLDGLVAGWLAAASYSLYLCHKGMFHLTGSLLGDSLNEHRFVRFAIYVAMTLAGGAVLHYAVERPFLRWRDRRLHASDTLAPPKVIPGVAAGD